MSNFTPEQIEQFLEEFFDVVGRRQYIGARYVPIFGRKDESSIDWDNTAPYEPLTIVLYQGNSYTSRTYVPTGIAITDTTYWAKTGNYNAQIEAYREEVLQFDSRITENANDISDEVLARQNADTSLSEDISDEVLARQNADTAIGNSIDTINEQIRLTDYRAIIYGDSTMREDAQGSSVLGSLIAQVTGMTISNRAVSGSNINDFLTLMTNASQSDFENYDFVFMAYCTNDWQGGTPIWDNMFATPENTFYNRLVRAFDRLDTIRGTCRPVFVMPAYGKNPTINTLTNPALNTNAVGCTLENYINCVMRECRKRRYGVIDLYHTMGVSENNYQQLFTRSSYDPEHEYYNIFVHYNQVLKERIARAFLDYFPYCIPSIEKDETVNKLIPNYQFVTAPVHSHVSDLHSLVALVSTYYKESGSLDISKQVSNGRTTLSFYSVGFTGRVQVTHFDSAGVSDEVRNWRVTRSGYYDLYIDDMIGRIDILFVPDSERAARISNLMLTDGHNSFPTYTQPSGCTAFKHSPSGWSTKGDATKVFSQISGNSLNVYFNRFTLTDACTTRDELMVIGNANMNVGKATVVVPCFENNSWGYIGLNLTERNNGISVVPQRDMASGAMIDAIFTVPLISPYIADQESW